MLARHRQLFATGVFFLDGAILFASWLGAYALRFYGLGLPSPLGVPALSLYLWIGAVLTLVGLLVLNAFRLYRSTRTARLGQEVLTLVQGVAILTALAAIASFFSRGELSRSALVLFGALAMALLLASRVAIRLVLRQLRRHGKNLRHLLVVGTGELAELVVRKIAGRPDYGLVAAGLVAADPGHVGGARSGVPVIGTIEELPALVESTHADLVYLALARSEYQAEELALRKLADSTAAVRLVPDLARAFTLNASVEDFDGLPVVLITESPGEGWNGVLKRAFDLVCSGLGLVVLSPVLLAVALWVRLDSRGPVLFAQERVGLNGRRFRMLKFRTMRVGADSGGTPAWSRPGDPRRTRAGRVLRATSLDELPQLWNVLLGEMSLVGPRPEQPYYVQRFRESVPRYMLRHHVKAGITGWAQINGLRGDTPLERRIEFDLYYIRNWSLAFDLKILLLTVVRVFRDASAQ
jgi:Undecaprenyl-phosphate glucose phosphotransferase